MLQAAGTRVCGWLKCCFTSTETFSLCHFIGLCRHPKSAAKSPSSFLHKEEEEVDLLGAGTQDGHLDFHTAPELYGSYTWCLTSTETTRLIRDGEKRSGEGVRRRGGGGGTEEGGGGGRLYTYRYTVTTRMTPVLRWAAVRAIVMFQ